MTGDGFSGVLATRRRRTSALWVLSLENLTIPSLKICASLIAYVSPRWWTRTEYTLLATASGGFGAFQLGAFKPEIFHCCHLRGGLRAGDVSARDRGLLCSLASVINDIARMDRQMCTKARQGLCCKWWYTLKLTWILLIWMLVAIVEGDPSRRRAGAYRTDYCAGRDGGLIRVNERYKSQGTATSTMPWSTTAARRCSTIHWRRSSLTVLCRTDRDFFTVDLP